jgi:hypothetical protein
MKYTVEEGLFCIVNDQCRFNIILYIFLSLKCLQTLNLQYTTSADVISEGRPLWMSRLLTPVASFLCTANSGVILAVAASSHWSVCDQSRQFVPLRALAREAHSRTRCHGKCRPPKTHCGAAPALRRHSPGRVSCTFERCSLLWCGAAGRKMWRVWRQCTKM